MLQTLGCCIAGKEESKESESLLAESNGHTAPVQARSIDVGVRGCFFWLSEHAERSMSMEERSSWMEATGKGECQDATVSTETFNSLPGTAFAGTAGLICLKAPLCIAAHRAGTVCHGALEPQMIIFSFFWAVELCCLMGSPSGLRLSESEAKLC